MNDRVALFSGFHVLELDEVSGGSLLQGNEQEIGEADALSFRLVIGPIVSCNVYNRFDAGLNVALVEFPMRIDSGRMSPLCMD